MDRLFKLSFPRPNAALIGLWTCQRCGSVHDSVESWVQVGIGEDGRDAQIICPACASELRR